MKKKGCLMVLILFLVILAGCSGERRLEVVAGVERNTDRSMSMAYEKFDGRKQTGGVIRVAPGEEVVVKVNVVTESGSLTIYIAPEKAPKDYVLESHDLETTCFTVTLTEEGNYLLAIEADDHKGSYSIGW